MIKVKINNDTWKVKLIKADAKKMNPSANRINLGLTEYVNGTISIREGLSESVTRSTIIHELVHAFILSYGHTVENDEALCDFFGAHADEILNLTEQIMGKWGKRNADSYRNK